MLLALDLPLPGICYAHGYFTIDGQKMSKSLGNVIDPNSLVDRFGSDAARYLIISQFSFGNDGDIKADDFITKYNSDLANGIGNLVSRVLGMVEKYFDGRVPESVYTADFDLKKFWSSLDLGYREVRLYDNVVTINELIKWCDLYIDSAKPWELVKTDPEKLVEVIYNLLELIRQLALAIIPYLPETSVAIWEKLSLENFNNFSITDLVSRPITPGQTVRKGEPLFLRLE
jgi:methionyl-tRNA synthetase